MLAKYDAARASLDRGGLELSTFWHKASLPANGGYCTQHSETVCNNLSFGGSQTQRPVLGTSLVHLRNSGYKTRKCRGPVSNQLKSIISHNLSFRSTFAEKRASLRVVPHNVS